MICVSTLTVEKTYQIINGVRLSKHIITNIISELFLCYINCHQWKWLFPVIDICINWNLLIFNSNEYYVFNAIENESEMKKSMRKYTTDVTFGIGNLGDCRWMYYYLKMSIKLSNHSWRIPRKKKCELKIRPDYFPTWYYFCYSMWIHTEIRLFK